MEDVFRKPQTYCDRGKFLGGRLVNTSIRPPYASGVLHTADTIILSLTQLRRAIFKHVENCASVCASTPMDARRQCSQYAE